MGGHLNRRSIGVNTTVPATKEYRNYKRPFWLPAVSYYFFTVAIVILVFFVVWWLLQEPRGGTPWIPSGIISGLLLMGSVLLREIYLRNAMRRYLAIKRRLDSNLNRAAQSVPIGATKFTLEQNARVLSEIERKSNAARTLGQLPDAHLEVFDMCEEYLTFTKEELNSIPVGSPRFGAIRRGRRRTKEFHKYHLIGWAAIESRVFTQEAQGCDIIEGKIETAKKALDVLNSALYFYPDDARLLESADVVKEFIASSKITDRIKKAEDAVANGNFKAAIASYKDALFYLARDEMKNKESDLFAKKIASELNRLREKVDPTIER